MHTPEFAGLQQSFQTHVGAHATPDSQAASPAAVEAAQQWLTVLQQSTVGVDAAAKRQLAGQVILLTYYELFDVKRASSALADLCPRCVPVNTLVLCCIF